MSHQTESRHSESTQSWRNSTFEDALASVDMENEVIACCLTNWNSTATAVEALTPDDFFNASNREVFRIILDRFSEGRDIDFATLPDALRDRKVTVPEAHMEDVGGRGKTPSKVEAYIEIVKKRSIQRSVIIAARSITDVVANEEFKDHSEIANRAEGIILEATQDKTKSKEVHVKDVLFDVVAEIEHRTKNRGITGLPLGFNRIDRMTGGLNPGELVIVAARPSMGKSAWVGNVSTNVAALGKKVAFFSLEMSKEELTERYITSVSQVDSFRMRRGEINQDELGKVADAANQLHRLPIYIDDGGYLSPVDLRAKCRRIKHKHGLDLIIVDYLQLMHGEGRSSVERVSNISRMLKMIAKEMGVPMIALSQLSREPDKREDPRPLLSDLRESGSIEQDADKVLFLFREELYTGPTRKDGTNVEGDVEFIMRKQRNGPTGMVRGKFIKETMTFYDVSY